MSDYQPNHTDSGRDDRQILLAALAIVSFVAVLAPLLVFVFTRSSETPTEILTIAATPSPVASVDVPSTPEVANGSLTLTAPATGTPIVSVTPQPATPSAPTATPATPVAATAAAIATAAPVVVELAGTAAGFVDVTGLEPGTALNVRERPGATNPLLGTLAVSATNVQTTGRVSTVNGNEWREITFNERTGWVFGAYVTSSPGPEPTDADVEPTVVPTPQAVQELATIDPQLFEVIGIDRGSSLSVRANPGVASSRIGSLANNATAVQSTGRRALIGDTEWKEVSFNAGVGWVSSTFLSPITSRVETVYIEAGGETRVGIVSLPGDNARLLLRSEPGYDQPSVGSVGESTTNVTATGQTAQVGDGQWAEISAGTATGWVPRALTTTTAPTLQQVSETGGIAAVIANDVIVTETNEILIELREMTLTVRPDAVVLRNNGDRVDTADWAQQATLTSVSPPLELTITDGEVTQIWVY